MNKGNETDKAAAETMMNENLSYIVPMQNKLRELKRNRSCEKEEDDETLCKDVSKEKIPALDFDQISGQETAKKQIKNGILYPILYPRLFPYRSKGILFYGPPGTGKTLLAKAFVNQLQSEAQTCFKKKIRVLLYAPSGGELKGKFVGETEKNIRKYFDCASKQASICEESNENVQVISVLFLDEVEAIAGDRSKDDSGMMTNSVNALLQMMDGVKTYDNVIVMAATNYPWNLDAAIMRRFDTQIHVTLPTETDIATLIKIEISEYIKRTLTIKTKTVQNNDQPDDPQPVAPEITEQEPPRGQVQEEVREQGNGDEKDNGETEKEVDVNGENSLSCGDGILMEFNNSETKKTPVDYFNMYRDRYFKRFTDGIILNIASKYKAHNFGGGDVKNACRYVFKAMANKTLTNPKFIKQYVKNEFIDETPEKEYNMYSEFGKLANTVGKNIGFYFTYPYKEAVPTNTTGDEKYKEENNWFNWNLLSSEEHMSVYMKLFPGQDKIITDIFHLITHLISLVNMPAYVKIADVNKIVENPNGSHGNIETLFYLDVHSENFKSEFLTSSKFDDEYYARVELPISNTNNTLMFLATGIGNTVRNILGSINKRISGQNLIEDLTSSQKKYEEPKEEQEQSGQLEDTPKTDGSEKPQGSLPNSNLITLDDINRLETKIIFSKITEIIQVPKYEANQANQNGQEFTVKVLSTDMPDEEGTWRDRDLIVHEAYGGKRNTTLSETNTFEGGGIVAGTNTKEEQFIYNMASGFMIDKKHPRKSKMGIEIAQNILNSTDSSFSLVEQINNVSVKFNIVDTSLNIMIYPVPNSVPIGGAGKTTRRTKSNHKTTKKKMKRIQTGGFKKEQCSNVNNVAPESIINFFFMESNFNDAIDKNNPDHVKPAITKSKLKVLEKYQKGDELSSQDKKT
jgi:AAA+ superfamily predicted ATPase